MKLALTATPRASSFAPLLLRGDMAAAFGVAAELGYDGVELHLRHPDDADRAAIRRAAAAHGMGMPTLGTGMAAGQDGLTFADPDPDVRRRAVERVKAHVDLAGYLHSAVTIGLIAGMLGGDESQRAVRRAAALDCLSETCAAAESKGVTVLLEPLNRYESDFLNTLSQATHVIREVGAKNLRLLADTFHMNVEEVDIGRSLREAGPLLGHVHFADSNRRAPGHGHIQFQDAIRALEDVGYSGYVSFECLPLPDGPAAAADAVKHVRRLCGGTQNEQ